MATVEKTATNMLLDRYAEVFGLTTGGQIARHLDVTPQAVSNWRNGLSSLDETACMQIAEALQLDPHAVRARVLEEREMSPRERKTWERYRGRVALAIVAAAIVGAGMTAGRDALASVNASNVPKSLNSLYIIRRIRAALRRARIRARPAGSAVMAWS